MSIKVKDLFNTDKIPTIRKIDPEELEPYFITIRKELETQRNMKMTQKEMRDTVINI